MEEKKEPRSGARGAFSLQRSFDMTNYSWQLKIVTGIRMQRMQFIYISLRHGTFGLANNRNNVPSFHPAAALATHTATLNTSFWLYRSLNSCPYLASLSPRRCHFVLQQKPLGWLIPAPCTPKKYSEINASQANRWHVQLSDHNQHYTLS